MAHPAPRLSIDRRVNRFQHGSGVLAGDEQETWNRARMASNPTPAGAEEFHDDIIYPATIPFVLVHLACLGAFWTGVTWQTLGLCVGLYVVRMFGVTAGYHRYFSHR